MARLDLSAAEIGGLAQCQPNADGLFDLGIINATGQEGEKDLVAAHKWFNLAARSGNAEAAYHRQQIAEDLTAMDVVRAQRAAREWLRVH